MSAITRAVFPVAGLGSRFLPATKASPKEMMPVDKPLVQYAVEEALAAGNTGLIFIRQSEALGLGHAVLCAKPVTLAYGLAHPEVGENLARHVEQLAGTLAARQGRAQRYSAVS